jgi:hypothetical protein
MPLIDTFLNSAVPDNLKFIYPEECYPDPDEERSQTGSAIFETLDLARWKVHKRVFEFRGGSPKSPSKVNVSKHTSERLVPL